MDKKTLIGIGIFVVILAGLLSVSMTMDTSAQSMSIHDSNISMDRIVYTLDTASIDIGSFNISVQDITGINYDCTLYVDSISYDKTGSFENLVNGTALSINITQILSPALFEGMHNATLDCSYIINMSTNGSQQQYIKGLVTSRNFTIDMSAPAINLSSPMIIPLNVSSGLNVSLDYSLNISVTDFSPIRCILGISANTLEYLSNVSIGNASNYSTGNTSYNPALNTLSINIPLHSTMDSSMPYVSYIIPFNVSCIDSLYNPRFLNSSILITLNISNSTYPMNGTGNQSNGNMSNQSNSTSNSSNIQIEPFFNIDMSKQAFDLGEIGYYTIDALNGSNVSITICPVASGWVQCYVALPFINESFPKIQGIPYTNRSGSYRIDGVMRYRNVTITKNATYDIANTLTASITTSRTTAGTGDTITFNASASSGIGSYNYKWNMHDGTVFYGKGAYKAYGTAGTYRVNLTVNDSLGNTFRTYSDVTIKNYHTLSVVVLNKNDGSRIPDVKVSINNDDDRTNYTNSNGVATFRMLDNNYNIYVSKNNYGGYVNNVELDSDKTVYMNMTFIDLTPPSITLLTDDNPMFASDAVDLKFKAEDSTTLSCSLYVAKANDSWYTLKDSGSDLISNTEYTFEVRDLTSGAYKWKIECSDKDSNKAYSGEKNFVVSDGEVTAALQTSTQDSSDLNKIIDNLDTLSGDESEVVSLLGIKTGLEDLLDRVGRLDKDIFDLSYRRDLNESGRIIEQEKLTKGIDDLKKNTPISLRVMESKTFVKYIRIDELSPIVGDYLSIKGLNLNSKAFSESTLSIQSKVIISTKVRTVELYYLDGRTEEMTLVVKDIQPARPEDDMAIQNSNTVTFIESIPKSISQSAKMIDMVTKDYTILKDDPLIEFPAATRQIAYRLDGKMALDNFEDTNTVMIDKSVDAIKSSTGFSILGISSISDIQLDARGMMIIAVIVLILFYLVMNFDIVDKIRNLITGSSAKKKISFIRVLINDSLDYMQTGDMDKASLIYREIKLTYESANDAVRRQVYDDSFDLCNKLDVAYALILLDNVERYLQANDKANAMAELEKLENTYKKIDMKYRPAMSDRFHRVLLMAKR